MAFSDYIDLRWIGNGSVDGELLESAGHQIERAYGVAARVSVANDRPSGTFDPKRRQHSSTLILRWMVRNVPEGARKFVTVTDQDLFIPVLTFVFGEAQLSGPCAVVSTARLRPGPGGGPTSPPLLRARLAKECVHELGHTFGLAHCSFSGCVMSRSNTLAEVDVKAAGLCRDCRRLLRELERTRGEES